MAEREMTLKWLRSEGDEWRWAARYLSQRLDEKYLLTLDDHALRRIISYEKVVTVIRQVQQDKPELVMKLQGAIRQRRYRSDSNGRKPVTFTLTKESIESLNRLSKKYKKNDTAIITELLGIEERELKAEIDYEKKLKDSISRERKIATQTASSLRKQRDEALKHAEKYLKLLARWELSRKDETPPAVDEKEIEQHVAPMMKSIKEAIEYIALRDNIFTDRE